MRIAGGLLAVLLICALHANAFAQGAPPPPPPPGGGGPTPPGPPSQFRGDAGLLIGIPQQDLADGADTSIGVRAAFGYNINLNLSVHATLRYIFVNVDSDVEEFIDSIRYYDFGIGGRYAFDLTGLPVRPFVDLDLLYTYITAESNGDSQTCDDPGVGVRFGATYPLRPTMDFVFALGYTKIFVSEDNVDAAWLELSGGVQAYF